MLPSEEQQGYRQYSFRFQVCIHIPAIGAVKQLVLLGLEPIQVHPEPN